MSSLVKCRNTVKYKKKILYNTEAHSNHKTYKCMVWFQRHIKLHWRYAWSRFILSQAYIKQNLQQTNTVIRYCESMPEKHAQQKFMNIIHDNSSNMLSLPGDRMDKLGISRYNIVVKKTMTKLCAFDKYKQLLVEIQKRQASRIATSILHMNAG